MEKYIVGNKEAWEEAFELRAQGWGEDIVEKVSGKNYAFFYPETIETFQKYDLKGKSIGQFCSNNGRELLSLVNTVQAGCGVGFDIASNMIEFANVKAEEMTLPCKFVETNILEIDDSYQDAFDFVIITEGALCWFKDLRQYFAVVSKCLKENGAIVITESHPLINTLASEDEEAFDDKHPANHVYSYFEHEWIGNGGMNYITGRSYESKTFTDYTHSMSEIIGAMTTNGIVITDLKELDYDIVGGFPNLNGCGIPLSMVIEGRKNSSIKKI